MLEVPLCFLTLGVQAAVNASAGVSRMPLRRYLPAVTVGALAWALMYTTIGMAISGWWGPADFRYCYSGFSMSAR